MRCAQLSIVILLASATGWIASCGSKETGPIYNYADLVQRLVDLQALATLPLPGERTAQWSSYDRASYYDPGTETYVNWDANSDGTGIVREEGNLQVIAEMEGPGVIWRIWTPIPGPGHVMIYLDGSDEPAIDLPFFSYFDGQTPPFTYPSLVYTAAMGQNSYIPIPFQKSCLIVAESNWGAYYHVTYSTFPEDTTLPTFQGELPPDAVAALEAVDLFLQGELGSDPAGVRTGEQTEVQNIVVRPGEVVTVVNLDGEGAITGIKVSNLNGDFLGDVLRELVLRISWDGEENPSVWAPLGDFFGTAPGLVSYQSLPMGMTEEGFYSYWYMPFSNGAVFELINEGNVEVSLGVKVTHAPLTAPVDSLGRFHAKWHRNAFPPEQPGREIDWTMLTTRGRGRFVGTVLHVWNPQGGWWGEGDEKFFVDGEKFPSIFGTGSEDYFGYGWCSEELFSRPYHGQTVSVPKNPCGNPDPEDSGGHTCNHRWQIAENVPFQVSLEATIEKYVSDLQGTQYANTVYWYMAPGGDDSYGAVDVEERTEYYQEPGTP